MGSGSLAMCASFSTADELIAYLESSCARPAPAREARLGDLERLVDQHAQDGHGDDPGEHARVVDHAPGVHDEVAQARGARDGLGQKQDGHRDARPHAQGREQLGQHGGQYHVPIESPAPRSQAARRQNGLLGHEPRGVAHAHEDLEEQREGDERDLGAVTQAEQHEQHRQQHDLGDGVGQVQHGGHPRVEPPQPPQCKAQRRGQHAGDGERGHDAVEAYPELGQQVGGEFQKDGDGRQGRGQRRRIDDQRGEVPAQQQHRHGEGVARDLPDGPW